MPAHAQLFSDVLAQMPAPDLLNRDEWIRARDAFGLSSQQGHIVLLLMRGERHKQIAAALGISPNTLHSAMRRLYKRVNVHDQTALVLRVIAVGRTP